jgi:glycosyltransferase involved in cell wall biosynthesis
VTGPRDGLRVAVLGGVPRALGGGGLEIQIERTTAALRDRGLDVRSVRDAPSDWAFDVLHVFGHTADVGHFLHHWRRQPAHLVVSPVVVVPERRERRLKVATRLPIPAFEPRVLRALATRADQLIALTRWEADLLATIGGRRAAPIAIVGNGVDRQPSPDRAELERQLETTLPDRYAIVVGAVSRRKRQGKIAAALAGVIPLVVVGGWEGGPGERDRFADAISATGGAWLGEIGSRELVDGLIAGAEVLIHLSDAEGQSLAVLEALALGTRCVLSDIPQQRELATRCPDLVTTVSDEAAMASALAPTASANSPSAHRADVPSWDDVAGELAGVYDSLSGPRRLWSERA